MSVKRRLFEAALVAHEAPQPNTDGAEGTAMFQLGYEEAKQVAAFNAERDGIPKPAPPRHNMDASSWSRSYEEELTAPLFGSGDFSDEDAAVVQAHIAHANSFPEQRGVLRACLAMERAFNSDAATAVDMLSAFTAPTRIPRAWLPRIKARLERRARHVRQRRGTTAPGPGVEERDANVAHLNGWLDVVLVPFIRSFDATAHHRVAFLPALFNFLALGGCPAESCDMERCCRVDDDFVCHGAFAAIVPDAPIRAVALAMYARAPCVLKLELTLEGAEETCGPSKSVGVAVNLVVGTGGEVVETVSLEHAVGFKADLESFTDFVRELCNLGIVVMESPFLFRLRTAADDKRPAVDVLIDTMRTCEMNGLNRGREQFTFRHRPSQVFPGLPYVPLTTRSWDDVAAEAAQAGRLVRHAEADGSATYSLPIDHQSMPEPVPDAFDPQERSFLAVFEQPEAMNVMRLNGDRDALLARGVALGILVNASAARQQFAHLLPLTAAMLGPNSEFRRFLALADEFLLSCVAAGVAPVFQEFAAFAAARYRLWQITPPGRAAGSLVAQIRNAAAMAQTYGCLDRMDSIQDGKMLFVSMAHAVFPQPLLPTSDGPSGNASDEQWQRAEAYLTRLKELPLIRKVLAARDLNAGGCEGDLGWASKLGCVADGFPPSAALRLLPVVQRLIQAAMLDLVVEHEFDEHLGITHLVGKRLGTPLLLITSSEPWTAVAAAGLLLLRQRSTDGRVEPHLPREALAITKGDKTASDAEKRAKCASDHLVSGLLGCCRVSHATSPHPRFHDDGVPAFEGCSIPRRGCLDALAAELKLPTKVVATLDDRRSCHALVTYVYRLLGSDDAARELAMRDTAMLAEAVACRMVSIEAELPQKEEEAEEADDSVPAGFRMLPGPTSEVNRLALLIESRFFSGTVPLTDSRLLTESINTDLFWSDHEWRYDITSDALPGVTHAMLTFAIELGLVKTDGDRVVGAAPLRKVAPGTAQELARWTRGIVRERFMDAGPTVMLRLKEEFMAHHRRAPSTTWPGVSKAKVGAILTQVGFENKAERTMALEIAVEAGAFVVYSEPQSGEFLRPLLRLVDEWAAAVASMASTSVLTCTSQPTTTTGLKNPSSPRQPDSVVPTVTHPGSQTASEKTTKKLPPGVAALVAAVRREREAAAKRAAAGGAAWAGLNRAQAGAALSAAGLATKKQRAEALRRATGAGSGGGGGDGASPPLVEGAEGQLFERGDPAAAGSTSDADAAIPSTAVSPVGAAAAAAGMDAQADADPGSTACPCHDAEHTPLSVAGTEAAPVSVPSSCDAHEERHEQGFLAVAADAVKDPAAAASVGNAAAGRGCPSTATLPCSLRSLLDRIAAEMAAAPPPWELREHAAREALRSLGVVCDGRLSPDASAFPNFDHGERAAPGGNAALTVQHHARSNGVAGSPPLPSRFPSIVQVNTAEPPAEADPQSDSHPFTAPPAAGESTDFLPPPRTLREIRERHGLMHDDGMANEVTDLAEPCNPWGGE